VASSQLLSARKYSVSYRIYSSASVTVNYAAFIIVLRNVINCYLLLSTLLSYLLAFTTVKVALYKTNMMMMMMMMIMTKYIGL